MTYCYARSTYDSPNPLVRFAHRSRFRTALGLVRLAPGQGLLDFGCGDGRFLGQLAGRAPEGVTLLGYDPLAAPSAEGPVPIFADWERVRAAAEARQGFDVVTCLEVLEHLPAPRLDEALARIASVTRPGGQVLVSVPIENGLPSLVKNTIRRFAYHEEHGRIYTVRNIVKSALSRPLPECRESEYCTHIGFYYWELERHLAARFTVGRRRFSPFPRLGAGLNSQVFYELRPLRGAGRSG